VVAASLGDHLLVQLAVDPDDESARHLSISAVGRGWAARWARLEAALVPFASPGSPASC
jgi:hypothetical protein